MSNRAPNDKDRRSDSSRKVSSCDGSEWITLDEFPDKMQCEHIHVEGPQPPDGGWGWVVAWGASIVSMLVMGMASSFGVLFSPQLLEWRASSTTTAVLFNGYMILWRVAGSGIATLIQEFGFRKLVMTGTLLCSASLILTAFATSPEYVFVFFSIGCGVGSGLSNISFLIVSRYFKRRRGLANTINTGGIGSGSFILPVFIKLLQDTYSPRGAHLVMGAVMLHGFLGATLYQPVEWHMKYPFNPQQVALISPGPNTTRSPRASQNLQNEKDVKEKVKQLQNYQPSASAKKPSADSDLEKITSFHTAADTDFTQPQYDHVRLDILPESNTSCNLWRTLTRIVKGLIRDLGILRRPMAIIIATGPTLAYNAYVNFSMMVPFAMQATGHSLQTAAWCLSLAGVMNLLARMLACLLSDYDWFNMRLCFLLSQFAMATSAAVFLFQTQVVGVVAVMVVWGSGMGVYDGLCDLYSLRIMGAKDYDRMFGARNFTYGLGFLTVGPLMGVIRDLSDSYASSMWVIATLLYVSLVLWLFIPAAVAYDHRTRRNQDSVS